MSISFAVFALAAVLAAFGCVLAVLVLMREVQRVNPSMVVAFYLWTVLTPTVIFFALSPRDFATFSLDTFVTLAGWVTWLNRFSSAALMCVALAVILVGLSRTRQQIGATFMAFSFFLLALSTVASATLSEVPVLIPNNFYPIVLMLSLFMLQPVQPEQVAVIAKRVLTMVMVGSLVMATIEPSQVAELNFYAGIIPGFHFRLAGLTPHANALAPLALLYLLLAAWVPGRHPWYLVGAACALLVLLLAQSKTNWIAGLLTCLTIVAFRVNKQFVSEVRSARLGWATLITFCIAIAAAFAVLLLLSDLYSGILESASQHSSIRTLTGRTDIWRVTIETWQNNPLFGYGPTIWNFDFRASHGMNFAFHAHNQYLQTLGEAGLLGLIAMVVYSVALVYYGFKLAARTRGVSLALILHLLIRTITEIPLRMNALLDATFFSHLVVFTIFLMLAREAAAKPDLIPAKAMQAAA